MLHIPKIVITGGPCAGKSTGLAAICTYLAERGFYPIVVEEIATKLMEEGLKPTQEDFQKLVLKHQLMAEADAEVEARKKLKQNPVILLDRGLNDGRAYCSDEEFAKALEEHGLNRVTARDMYSGVIHMVSAAYGAESFYTRENNDTRYEETIEDARAQDDKTKVAWHGTPHLSIVPNLPGLSFDDKIQQVLRELSRVLGIPEPLECERKFKLLEPQKLILPPHAVAIDIVQTYLVSREQGVVERVRARGQHDNWLFFNTLKEPRGHGLVSERDSIVSRERYDNLLIREDRSLRRIHKTRHCFTHEGHYCELDVYLGHLQGQAELEIEVHDINDPISLPEFLGPLEEVTGDSTYSNYAKAAA